MPALLLTCALTLAAAVALAAAPQAQEPRAAADVCPGNGVPPVDTVLALTLCRAAVQIETPWGAPAPGARIATLAPEGPGARAGLRAGDVIYQVAGRRVSSGVDAAARLEAPGQRILLINFWRDGAPRLVRIWPD